MYLLWTYTIFKFYIYLSIYLIIFLTSQTLSAGAKTVPAFSHFISSAWDSAWHIGTQKFSQWVKW